MQKTTHSPVEWFFLRSEQSRERSESRTRVNGNVEFSLQTRTVAFIARCSIRPRFDNLIWACGTLPNKLIKYQFVRGVDTLKVDRPFDNLIRACGGMVDTLVLGTSANAWEFESLHAHHKGQN